MENPDLGQAFSNLNAIISPIEKFLEPLGAEEFLKNVEESKKFRESQLALKSKILCFLLISKRSFIFYISYGVDHDIYIRKLFLV